MHARRFFLSALVLLGLAGCTGVPTGTGRAGRVTTITGDFPALTPGMTTTEIRQRFGEPAEIQPMTAAGTAPEVWVYHLKKSLGRTTVLTGLTGDLSSGSLAGDYRQPLGPRPRLCLGRAEAPPDPPPPDGRRPALRPHRHQRGAHGILSRINSIQPQINTDAHGWISNWGTRPDTVQCPGVYRC